MLCLYHEHGGCAHHLLSFLSPRCKIQNLCTCPSETVVNSTTRTTPAIGKFAKRKVFLFFLRFGRRSFNLVCDHWALTRRYWSSSSGGTRSSMWTPLSLPATPNPCRIRKLANARWA